jgi:hypothetical protein
LARELGVPSALIRPLNNTAAFLGGRDVGVALASAEECLALAKQAGYVQMLSLAGSNLALGLWNAGRWQELRARLAGDLADADPRMRMFLLRRLAAATGTEPVDAAEDTAQLAESEDLQVRAWSLGASAAGLTDPSTASRRAELAAEAARSCAALSGIDDDFVYQWVQAVEAAAAVEDAALLTEMLDLVRQQPPGLRNPLVRGEYLRLQATYAPAATADPEGDLRQAVAALSAFGAPFPRAQAELVLAELLAAQGRPEQATELLESARATFEELAAAPWLARAERVLSPV